MSIFHTFHKCNCHPPIHVSWKELYLVPPNASVGWSTLSGDFFNWASAAFPYLPLFRYSVPECIRG